ncbi:hypothetical protein JMK10_20640 [Rhodovulum sulfidophilum]|uniref:hypothetical protein n=1 Tax=Rhodovulum sulfidophilum TaxID=35806 RepID=UPI0019239C05|nr:hypothetical protein [Rhodovulum sulfidophilum]MBL3576325.1 hypothetical protein [Rhodovulum sulfidophilum]MCE8433720.1 hypothetical protein [Rhodovulum sulfidophilum]MCF4119095.1 hypothetical protein [Rhodovulum sulfidophilum]
MTETSVYDPPEDLADVSAEANCEADISILIREPKSTSTDTNTPSGAQWAGVKELGVELKGAGIRIYAETSASGVASFSAVPCGNYQVNLMQKQFKVENLSNRTIAVSSGRKLGSEFEIEVRRQLLTVEMLRLPTLYIAGAKAGMGKSVDADQDPYGHHWVKIYKDAFSARLERPMESYGWWPIEPASADKLWDGVKGSLNGFPIHSRFENRDPYHKNYFRDDKKLEEAFLPYVTNGCTADEYKNKLRAKAKSYAGISGGTWSWRGNGAGYHCKTFQTYLMRESYLWRRLGVGIGGWGWSANT